MGSVFKPARGDPAVGCSTRKEEKNLKSKSESYLKCR